MHRFFNPTFKRSQIDWLLWQAFFLRMHVCAPLEPDVRFLNKIKRLLNIDETLFITEVKSGHAYLSQSPEGTGMHRVFSVYDVFLLGISLDLLDAGFNQQEVVFLIQHIRAKLKKDFLRALRLTPSGQPMEGDSFPPLPKFSKKGMIYDYRCYLVFQQITLEEVHRPGREKSKNPAINAPNVHYGLQALAEAIDKDEFGEAHTFILEFSKLVGAINDLLQDVPPAQRGRKSKVKNGKGGK